MQFLCVTLNRYFCASRPQRLSPPPATHYHFNHCYRAITCNVIFEFLRIRCTLPTPTAPPALCFTGPPTTRHHRKLRIPHIDILDTFPQNNDYLAFRLNQSLSADVLKVTLKRMTAKLRKTLIFSRKFAPHCNTLSMAFHQYETTKLSKNIVSYNACQFWRCFNPCHIRWQNKAVGPV